MTVPYPSRRRSPARMVLAAFVVAMVVLGFPRAARGAAAQERTRLTIRFQQATREGVSDTIVARLTRSDGDGVAGATVTVLVDVTAFRGEPAVLARATTDASGVAAVPIDPTRQHYDLRARYAGNESLAPAEVTAQIDLPASAVGSNPGHRVESPLTGTRHFVPRLVAGLVVAAWALFVFGIVWVLRRIHRHGAALQPAESTGR